MELNRNTSSWTHRTPVGARCRAIASASAEVSRAVTSANRPARCWVHWPVPQATSSTRPPVGSRATGASRASTESRCCNGLSAPAYASSYSPARAW